MIKITKYFFLNFIFIKMKDLDGDDVMILDGLNTIFVWIGNGANNQERDAAKTTAKAKNIFFNFFNTNFEVP